jgi:hypothetical protein
MNWWILALPLPAVATAGFYTLTLPVGFLFLSLAGAWMRRLLKNNLMDDVFPF